MMGYRTLEISTSCEIHIKEGQLEVTSDSGSILIPIEDLSQIMVHGANIRLSTMDLSILSPTDKWGTKTEYARLRKFFLKDGYIRIGPEVFMRVVQNRKASEKHYRRIDEVKPKTGVVRLLRLTEKRYNNIYMVTGEPDYQEKTVGVNCHIMI